MLVVSGVCDVFYQCSQINDDDGDDGDASPSFLMHYLLGSKEEGEEPSWQPALQRPSPC